MSNIRFATDEDYEDLLQAKSKGEITNCNFDEHGSYNPKLAIEASVISKRNFYNKLAKESIVDLIFGRKGK